MTLGKVLGKTLFVRSNDYVGHGQFLGMFAEDIKDAIWSQFRHRQESSLTWPRVDVRIEPEDKDFERLAEKLISAEQFQTFRDHVGTFVGQTAQLIVEDGGVPYELVTAHDEMDSAVSFARLRPVYAPGGRVIRLGANRIVQMVPASIASAENRPRFLFPEPADTFYFGVPKLWRRELRQACKAIRTFDNFLKYRDESIFESLRSGYGNSISMKRGLKRRQALEDRALAQGVGSIGWDARSWFAKSTTEYHAVSGLIRWIGFSTAMRDECLKTLGQAVERLAQIVNCPSRMIVTVEEPERLDRALVLLNSENVSYDEILEVLGYPRV